MGNGGCWLEAKLAKDTSGSGCDALKWLEGCISIGDTILPPPEVKGVTGTLDVDITVLV